MCISVDGSRIRNNKVAFSNLSGIVWTGPKLTHKFFRLAPFRVSLRDRNKHKYYITNIYTNQNDVVAVGVNQSLPVSTV